MNQHTEGPWFVDGNSIAHQSGDIATLDGVRPHEEEDANARLMAEAPMMYEALEIIAHNLIPNGSKAQIHNQLSYAIGVAVQAIAEIESTQEN